jgi:hypothetical protein
MTRQPSHFGLIPHRQSVYLIIDVQSCRKPNILIPRCQLTLMPAHLVLPWHIEVVLITEAGPWADAKLGDRAASSREPNRLARGVNRNRWMSSQPIATWMTPCNSRSVMLAGTRTGR